MLGPTENGRRPLTLGSWSWDGLAGAVAALTVPFVVEGPANCVLLSSGRRSASGQQRCVRAVHASVRTPSGLR